jgi:pseudouridine-5'-phosphate glycosidase
MTDTTAGETIGIHPEIRDAIAAGRPVVALESTIITHGMPFPDNLSTAMSVEAMVREQGALPATIAVIRGQLRVGLDPDDLEQLAATKGALKASRRDLGMAMVRRSTAGTTVAATMWLAARAGIRLFATGGIGGVHRGAAETFDVSADLMELGSSPVAVVCAGAKSILDIPKTLEYLETQGVPVIGYGTDLFPAFFARSSGERIEHRLDTPAEIAALIKVSRQLGLPGGLLIANPIPEAQALPEASIAQTIDEATRDAQQRGVGRKALTPFLLGRVLELTKGESLTANIALVRNNARLAAQVAVALSRLG